MNDILDIIEGLSLADRIGADEDIPEGARYIQLSDTLACKMVLVLKRINEAVDWS